MILSRNSEVSRPTTGDGKCQVLLLHVCFPIPLSLTFVQCNPLGAGRVLPPSGAVVNLNVVLRITEDLAPHKLYGCFLLQRQYRASELS